MNFEGLNECIDDVIGAGKQKTLRAPPNFKKLAHLREELRNSRKHLPEQYADELLQPFLAVLNKAGDGAIEKILGMPVKNRQRRLLQDIAQAITQHKHPSRKKAKERHTALAAAHEVVADLYDGFFDEVAQQKVRAPARRPLAPFVGWVNGEHHRTWTADQTAALGPRVPIVMAPVGGVRGGLLAWAILAHEVVGHDVLHAYDGLLDELKDKVWAVLIRGPFKPLWPEYWSSRVDEAASDIMAVLNMGPAYGIALIGYLRAQNKLYRPRGRTQLRRVTPRDIPSPADPLRVFLVAETVRLLKSNTKSPSPEALEKEAERDMMGKQLKIDGMRIGLTEARDVARVVARTIVLTPLDHLKDGYGKLWFIGEFQDWTSEDEMHVMEWTERLVKTWPEKGAEGLPKDLLDETFAAYVVAAAVIAAVRRDDEVSVIFSRMKEALARKHKA